LTILHLKTETTSLTRYTLWPSIHCQLYCYYSSQTA